MQKKPSQGKAGRLVSLLAPSELNPGEITIASAYAPIIATSLSAIVHGNFLYCLLVWIKPSGTTKPAQRWVVSP